MLCGHVGKHSATGSSTDSMQPKTISHRLSHPMVKPTLWHKFIVTLPMHVYGLGALVREFVTTRNCGVCLSTCRPRPLTHECQQTAGGL